MTQVIFDMPDDVVVTGAVAAIVAIDMSRIDELDENNQGEVYIKRLPGTNIVEAAELGLITHSYYHNRIMGSFRE